MILHHEMISMQPILASDYPPVMREKIDAKSAAQGFPESRSSYLYMLMRVDA